MQTLRVSPFHTVFVPLIDNLVPFSVRHELQMVTTPPEPWVSASFEQLLAHCKSEHPAAWQQVLEAEEDDEEEEEEGGAAEA